MIKTAKFKYVAGEKVKIEQLGSVMFLFFWVKHDNLDLLMQHFSDTDEIR